MSERGLEGAKVFLVQLGREVQVDEVCDTKSSEEGENLSPHAQV